MELLDTAQELTTKLATFLASKKKITSRDVWRVSKVKEPEQVSAHTFFYFDEDAEEKASVTVRMVHTQGSSQWVLSKELSLEELVDLYNKLIKSLAKQLKYNKI